MKKAILVPIMLIFFIVIWVMGCGEESEEPEVKGGKGSSIVSMIPENGTKDVSATTAIVVVFNKGIAAPSIANFTFTPNVNGTISYNPETYALIFKPSAALSNYTNYTMTIKNITDTEGNAVPSITSSFTTSIPDIYPPEIILTSPENKQKDVGHDAKISLKFSEPIYRDKLISSISFDPTIKVSVNDLLLEWAAGSDEQVTIFPSIGIEPFEVNQSYTMMVRKDSIVDLSGNPMVTDYKLNFSTLRYPVEKIKDTSMPDIDMVPVWMYDVGRQGNNWVVIWGGTPPSGSPSQAGPNGTITASSDGRISENVSALNSRGGDEFKPTVSSGNGNSLAYRTADLDNQKKFRIIFSSSSSYLTFDLRSSAGTIPAKYVYIGNGMEHPSRTPFIMKNK